MWSMFCGDTISTGTPRAIEICMQHKLASEEGVGDVSAPGTQPTLMAFFRERNTNTYGGMRQAPFIQYFGMHSNCEKWKT